MALISDVGQRPDPVLGYNFVVSLIDTSSPGAAVGSIALGAIFDAALGGFSECSGLDMTLDVHEHEEGGRNGHVLRFPTRVKWSNITLKRGIGLSTGLWDWHYDFAEGRGTRRDGVIVLLNDLRVPHSIWHFRRGLPVRYTGPTMNAQRSEVAIEAIEIAHEGVWQVPYAGVGTAGATVQLSAALG